MDDFILARAIHVLAVVVWIGGVAFVTTVVFPAMRNANPGPNRLAAFHRIEQRFAWQARIWVSLAGLTGFWMVWRAHLWDRLLDPTYWWMHAMVGLWLAFTLMLFVIEPFFLHRRMANSPNPERDFRLMERVHRVLMLVGFATILGAVAGSHGLI